MLLLDRAGIARVKCGQQHRYNSFPLTSIGYNLNEDVEHCQVPPGTCNSVRYKFLRAYLADRSRSTDEED